MNLRPRAREREEVGVNLTPLIDVVFLLLIFFMVSTTFRNETDLEIQLPEATQEATPADQQRILIAIDKSGHYFVNDGALPEDNIEAIKAALLMAAADDRSLPIVIRADAATAHQAVVRAMDAAGQLGFRRLAIATVEGRAAQDNAD